MRALLVLVAAAALPLFALAQPVAGDSTSTVVSELAVEGRGGQCPPGDPHRSGAVSRMFEAQTDTRNRRTDESPGTRALVLMLVAGSGTDNIDYSHIDPRLAKVVRAQGPRTKSNMQCLGVFKGVRFLHVGQAGWDDFEVDFSNGALEWAVKPFNAHQMTEGIVYGYDYPQPATDRLDDLLKSMERGRPNYADLALDAASKLQARWPALQTSLKAWGGLKGFRFVGKEDDGAYLYLATYEHRQVVWTAALPDAGGKITVLRYDERAG